MNDSSIMLIPQIKDKNKSLFYREILYCVSFYSWNWQTGIIPPGFPWDLFLGKDLCGMTNGPKTGLVPTRKEYRFEEPVSFHLSIPYTV